MQKKKETNIIISEEQYKRLFILNEGQYNRLFENVDDEGIELTNAGKKGHPAVNMRFNTSREDDDNIVKNNPLPGKNQINMDTRMSNWGNSITRGTLNGLSKEESILYYAYGFRLMIRAKLCAGSKGRKQFTIMNDERVWKNDPRMTPRVLKFLRTLAAKTESAVDRFYQAKDYEGLYQWAKSWGMDKDLDNYINMNLYNRVKNGEAEDFGGGRTASYMVGLVPGTNVKIISLFKFNDFNISDAIKNGTMRPNKQVAGITGQESKNKIPVTYDNGIKADIYNNFSKDENGAYDGVDHFKKSYGLNDENYTTVTNFIDKSIMYAAYALKKEKYSPDYIVAAPSSSQFNPLYATALANKLGTAKFIDGFFQRNLINFTDEQGQAINEKMRKNGIDERLIAQFNAVMKDAAMSEMASYVAAPIRKLVQDYYTVFADISKEAYSRERADVKMIEGVLVRYFYEYMVRDMKTLESMDEVGKYLLEKFNGSNKYIYGYEKYVAEEARKRINTKIGKRVFIKVINEMWKNVQYLDEQLKGRGYKLMFNQKFKISELSRKLRGYLTNLYVVADKNFNENRELFKSYQQGKFLIVDDDMNSGASLKSAIYAMDDVVPDENPDKLVCLTNAYYGSGF